MILLEVTMNNFHPNASYLPGANSEQVEYERQQLLSAVMQDRANNPGHVSAVEKQLVQFQLCRCSNPEEIGNMIPDIHMALKMEGLPISIEEIKLMADEYIKSKYPYQSDNPNTTSLTAIYFIIMLIIGLIIAFYFSNK